MATKFEKGNKKSTYWELLKDPRWQKRRLEIMNYAGFMCQVCGDSESTLNVHHVGYKKNANPWEYEDSALICMCESCHKEDHRLQSILDNELFTYKCLETISGNTKEFLIGILQAMNYCRPMGTEVEFIGDDQCKGIAMYFGYKANDEHKENGIEVEDIIYKLAMNLSEARNSDTLVINFNQLDWFFNRQDQMDRIMNLALTCEYFDPFMIDSVEFWPNGFMEKVLDAKKQYLEGDVCPE